MKAIFFRNYKLYLMEALGLAIFMVSACFFTAMLENPTTSWHKAVSDPHTRLVIIAAAMGATALFIFYSPVVAPSGAYINPAVTLVQLRLKNIHRTDAIFYIIFQFIGGTVAVYVMALLMGSILTTAPVNYVVTIPGKNVPIVKAAFCEVFISFVMIIMILNTGVNEKLKKYTKLFAAVLVFANVMLAGPVSGFGMNPARSFASALPAHIWTNFWIYIICPLVGMFAACEVFLYVKRRTL